MGTYRINPETIIKLLRSNLEDRKIGVILLQDSDLEDIKTLFPQGRVENNIYTVNKLEQIDIQASFHTTDKLWIGVHKNCINFSSICPGRRAIGNYEKY